MNREPDGVRLRPVRWQDIPRLAALERLVFGEDAWSQETWWEELAGRPRRWYVAADRDPAADGADGAGGADGAVGARGSGRAGAAEPPAAPSASDAEILGYAGLDLGGETADVMTVAVAPHARGSGLGSRLVDALVAAAAAGGAAYLLLEVRADNLAARRLYERKGFCVLATRARYYQPGDVDAIVLRLALPEAAA